MLWYTRVQVQHIPSSFRSSINDKRRAFAIHPFHLLRPAVDQLLQEASMLLAGDIGGTKTVLAVFSPEAGAHAPLAEATFPSGRYGRLEAIVREFLAQVTFPIDRACFGVAGAVGAGTAQGAQLSWVVREASPKENLRWGAGRGAERPE